MSDDVRLSAELSSSQLGENASDTLVYALIKVESTVHVEAGMPLNAVWVIERSPAMDDEGRLAAVQQALRPLVDELGDRDTLSLVVAGDRPKLVLPIEPTLDKDKAKRLVAFLDSQPAGDRPALADAIKLATDELRKHFSRTAVNHVLVVSATPGPQDAEAERQARMLAEGAIGFSTFGFGAHWNGPTLTHMADAGRGRLTHVPRAVDFAPAAQATLTHLRRLPIAHAKLFIRLAKGVKLRRLFQVSPSMSHWLPEQPTERDAVVRLGDLNADEPRFVLAELVMPPMAPGTYRLATVDVAYDLIVPTHQAGRTGAVDLVATVGEAGPVSQEVMRYVEAVSIFSLVERAIEARRDVPKAVQLLRNAHRIASQSGETRVNSLLEMAAKTLEQAHTLPEAISKALYMAVRSL